MRISDTDSSSGSLPAPSAVNTLPNVNNKLLVNPAIVGDTNAEVLITASAIGRKPLVLQRFSSSQTAALLEFQSETGAVMSSINAVGVGTFNAMDVGAIYFKRQGVTTATFTLASFTNQIVGVNFAGACTITLPAANYGGATYLPILYFMDESGAAGTNNITITAAGTDKLNGVTNGTSVINTNSGAKILYSNGSNAWFVLSAS